MSLSFHLNQIPGFRSSCKLPAARLEIRSLVDEIRQLLNDGYCHYIAARSEYLSTCCNGHFGSVKSSKSFKAIEARVAGQVADARAAAERLKMYMTPLPANKSAKARLRIAEERIADLIVVRDRLLPSVPALRTAARLIVRLIIAPSRRAIFVERQNPAATSSGSSVHSRLRSASASMPKRLPTSRIRSASMTLRH